MALSTDKKIFVALGVVAVLGAGLYVQQKGDAEDARKHGAAGVAASLPTIALAADDVDKITEISIDNAGKGQVVLQKDGEGKWLLVKPLSWPANAQNVKQALDSLKELKVKDVIDPGSGQYVPFDLVSDKAVHVVAKKGSDVALDLFFGKNGSRGQTVRLASKDGVYVASGWSSYLFAREVKGWRDGKIFDFDDANVASATITNENGAFSFSKNGDAWSGTFKGQPIADFDEAKVKDYLRAFKSLAAEDYGDGKTPEDAGLDRPSAVITFTLKDGAGERRLAVGKVATGTSRFAQAGSAPTIYVVSGWASDWATAAVSKFQKSAAPAGSGAARAPAAPAGKPPAKK